MRQIAIHCRTPMVWTFLFPMAEWYCLECGTKMAMFGPLMVDSTPELEEKAAFNKARFNALADGIIAPGMRRVDCPECRGSNHDSHATQAQWLADGEARLRLHQARTPR